MFAWHFSRTARRKTVHIPLEHLNCFPTNVVLALQRRLLSQETMLSWMQPMNWNLVIEKLLSCTNIRYVKANIFRNYNLSSIEIELLALCMFCKWTNMYPCRHSSTHRCVLADTAPFIDVFLHTQLHSSMCSSTHYVYRFHEDATISLLLQQNPTLHLPDRANHTESTIIINQRWIHNYRDIMVSGEPFGRADFSLSRNAACTSSIIPAGGALTDGQCQQQV